MRVVFYIYFVNTHSEIVFCKLAKTTTEATQYVRANGDISLVEESYHYHAANTIYKSGANSEQFHNHVVRKDFDVILDGVIRPFATDPMIAGSINHNAHEIWS